MARAERALAMPQVVFGSENCHLYEFQVGARRLGRPDVEDDWGEPGGTESENSTEQAVTAPSEAAGRKRHRAFVLRALRTALAHEPAKEARNRGLLALPAPFGAHWELRFGPQGRFRAFYTIEGATVVVVAIGVKDRERLRIGHEEVRSREGRIHRGGESE